MVRQAVNSKFLVSLLLFLTALSPNTEPGISKETKNSWLIIVS